MAPPANSADINKSSLEKPKPNKKKEEKKNKRVNEIEEIFKAAKGNKKRKELPSSSAAVPTQRSDLENKVNKKNTTTKKIKKDDSNKSEGEASSRKRRKTSDGLTVYSAEELGIKNPDAGGTPLCPFDCSYCF